MADGLSQAVNGLVKVGIGVFVIILIMVLAYSGYAQSRNVIQSASWASCNSATNCAGGTGVNALSPGVVLNYTTNGSGVANTFGSNIQLAVFALIFAAIILAVVSSLREATGAGESGGFL